MSKAAIGLALGLCAWIAAAPEALGAPAEPVPAFLRDRGAGVPTSMFGTYVRPGELLVYPFFEYYLDDDLEYAPAEFGYGLDRDFRGRYRAAEGLLFLGYGVSERLAVEFEAAVIAASLDKAADDPSATPARIEESGVGDVEAQLRWRWTFESARRPEWFSYFEAVAPLQRDKVLIGTPDWEFKLGTGVIRGFPWGTLTARAAVEYAREESKGEFGEYALEYLRRLSPAWRLYLGIEGSEDEIEWISEAQWHFADGAFLKLNNAFGVTAKATDWAPEIGCVFALPLARR